MRHIALIPALALLAVAGAAVPPRAAADEPARTIAGAHADPVADGPLIQVALLLDDSGSMQGLINQARAQLWDLINLLGSTTRDGRRPRVEVALYHYGDLPFLAAPLVPFSRDLDLVSERLFSVNGGGGTEACGQVIDNALRQLAWSTRPDALRLLVIAGNEPFTQGPVEWSGACRRAAARGIVLHTIHCGPREAGAAGMWEAAAQLGRGTFTCIDHDRAEVSVRCPQDDELALLNGRLNATYLPYGADGAERKERQSAQDNAAASAAPAALASRVAAKASGSYRNGAWDLVDAVKEKEADVKTLPAEALPERLRGLDPAAREAEVARLGEERARIQARIAALAREREAFQAEARRQAGGGAQTLGLALREAVLASARAQGFTPAP